MKFNYRKRFRNFIMLPVAALCVATGYGETVRGGQSLSRPNIIVILADDMGYSDLGSYGSEIATPHIDRLAEGGLRFTQVYNTSKCFPSRAALLTGVYAQQVGYGESGGYKNTIQNAITLGELLQQLGYRTYWSGKHHGVENPTTRGFDRYSGLRDGGCNYFNPGNQRPGEPVPARKPNRPPRVWRIDGKTYEPYTPEDPDFYTTDAFTDYALEWLENHDTTESPFFLYLSYTAPHDPLMAWPEDIAKYEGVYDEGYASIRRQRFERQRGLGLWEDDAILSAPTHRNWEDLSKPEKKEQIRKMEVYAAMIDRMDQNVGRILNQIREMGVEKNTLILVASDNGASAEVVKINESGTIGTMDRWSSLGPDWANVSNTPFRLFKNDSYEGGIRTPFIAYWPEGIKGDDRITDVPAHFIDIMATFVDITGSHYPKEFNGETLTPLQGRSLLPVFRGASRLSERPLYWEWREGRAVRLGDWKLVTGGEEWELFNMKSDPSEMQNLAGTHTGIRDALITLHDLWRNRVMD